MCLRWRESDMKNLILTPDLAILSNPWRPMRSTNVTCIITKPKNTINTPVRFTTRYAPVNFFLLNQTNPVKAKSILFFENTKAFSCLRLKANIKQNAALYPKAIFYKYLYRSVAIKIYFWIVTTFLMLWHMRGLVFLSETTIRVFKHIKK